MRRAVLTTILALTACVQANAYTPPPVGGSIDLQYTGKINPDVPVTVLNLDGFDTSAETVAALRARGVYPMCYINVGASENWRPDMASFPKEILGNAYDGWDGEHWLDIRRIDLLGPILAKRFEMCREKGFLGVDPDNLDSYQQSKTGFPITEEDQIKFLKWISKTARKQGLAIGLKNAPELVPQLVNDFDWVLTESCFDQQWCGELTPFRKAGKPVYMIEYTDNKTKAADMCVVAKRLGFTAVLKHRELDQYRESCD